MGDFDADGNLDVLNRSFTLWRGDGTGEFSAPETVPTGLDPTHLRGMLAPDLDGDGDSDLVLSFSIGGLHVLINEGKAASFRDADFFGMGLAAPAAVLDLDGDGDEDLAAPIFSPFPGVSILVNQGDGSFVEGEFSPVDVDLRDMDSPFSVGDIDGDGEDDLAGGLRRDNTVLILLGRGGGRFSEPLLHTVRSPEGTWVADIDQDGDRDLLVSSAGGFSVLVHRRGGELAPPFEYRLGREAGSILTADLDESGRVDLAWLDRSNGTVAILRDISRTAESLDENANGMPDECEGPSFHRGDANDDGKLDISDALSVIRHQFFAGETLSCKDGADANDDGRLDIADAVWIFSFLYCDGPSPPDPGPPGSPCGRDPRAGGGSLGCIS
jgi:hypothetical protein